MTATRDRLREFARRVLLNIERGKLTGEAATAVATWVRDHVPPEPAMGTRPAAARATDRPTAHAAAASVNVTELEAKVLAALRLCPAGATSHHVAQMTGIPLVSVSPRMAVLERAGRIADSGERRQTSGRARGIVWTVLPVAAERSA